MGVNDNLGDLAVFARRILVVLGLAALVFVLLFLVWELLDVLLLVFAAILLTLAVEGVVRLIRRYLPLGRGWALLVALLLMLLLAGGLLSLILPQAMEQTPQLVQQLPQALQQIGSQLPWAEDAGEEALEQASGDGGMIGQEMLGHALGVFSTTFGAISSILLVALIAIYLVLNPAVYIGHLLQLLPSPQRTRIRQMFAIQGKALRLWLLGRLLSMLFVGVFATIGLLLLGVPMAFTLGLIAGIATFIPYLGPLIGAVPAVLVAFLEGPQIALYVILLYFAVETAESSLIYPLAQRRVVDIPPAYTVVIQIAGGVLGGMPGVILATPLAVAAAVAIQMLYVEDVLGEQVHVLGD